MKITEHSILKWILPGTKIKRYILALTVGIILVLYSTAVIYFSVANYSKVTFIKKLFLVGLSKKIPFGEIVVPIVGIIILFIAISLIVIGLKELIVSISSALVPDKSRKEIMNLVFEKRREDLKKKIVVIGGGTGTSTVLKGLKKHFVKISAIITVADSGGSSGKLRKEMGILPPGDLRNCLVALADDNSEVARLLDFRFSEKNSCLNGHSMGNLLIAALTRMNGDFGDAVIELSKMLSISGEVMPFTTEDITLCAEFEDGNIIEGESEITAYHGKIKRIYIKPDNAKPYIEALKRIESADVIAIGPGSLYTSVIPPILLPTINDTVRRSKGTKVYISNIMTEPGETDGFTAYDHAKAIIDILGNGTIDYVLVNSGTISKYVEEKYKDSGAEIVKPDVSMIETNGIKCVKDNFAIERGDTVRHNPEKLAKAILEIAKKKV
jgi:uncharacterized cofD-like protein